MSTERKSISLLTRTSSQHKEDLFVPDEERMGIREKYRRQFQFGSLYFTEVSLRREDRVTGLLT